MRDLEDFHKLIRIGEHETMETSTFLFRDSPDSPRATNKEVYHICGTNFEKVFFCEADERATLDAFIPVFDILTSTPRRVVDEKALKWLVEQELAGPELMDLESAQVYPDDEDTLDFVHLELGLDGQYTKRAQAPPSDQRDDPGPPSMARENSWRCRA